MYLNNSKIYVFQYFKNIRISILQKYTYLNTSKIYVSQYFKNIRISILQKYTYLNTSKIYVSQYFKNICISILRVDLLKLPHKTKTKKINCTIDKYKL